jgi:hypothetical protein
MGLASEELQMPQDLKDIILSKRCVAFVGSGLSTGCYHAWPDLINDLCKCCGIQRRVSRDSPADAFLDAAQNAKDADEEAYYTLLGDHFGKPAKDASLLYDALLSLPFECYVTVNLDPLLALKSRTVKEPCKKLTFYPSLDRKGMTYRSVHYLHGYIAEGSAPRPGTIVLARGEFEDAYGDNSNLMNLLVPTLENDPIVFIGCRLREPVMPRVFNICQQHQKKRLEVMTARGRTGCNLPPRFIFLPEPTVTRPHGQIDAKQMRRIKKQEDAYYKQMGITPVWYQAPEDDHYALRYALERLAELPVIEPSYGWEGGMHGH